MFTFEQFPVYQSAEKLYAEMLVEIHRIKVPNYLVDQITRSLSSIVLNIAEGAGKYSKKDKRSFYLIARGSCHESAAALTLLKHHGLDPKISEVWYKELETISKMLSGLIRSLEK